MAEMLQLQRFAEPEPVRRYAPQTPEQLERLIGQLLSKDTAQRFPNVLVLSRHMEAMQKALSRPVKPQPDEGQVRLTLGDAHATAAPVTDETLSATEAGLERLETTDSGVYDAPTLADDGQGAPAGAVRSKVATNSGAKSAAVAAPPAPAPAPFKREPRFTTVEEERRRAQRERGEWLALAGQLAGLAAALAALAWIGWKLTRPATADDLYATMSDLWQAEDADLRKIDDEITEFLDRFPDDARAAEVRGFADELELQKIERRLRTQARLTGSAAAHPAEQVYADAIALAATDPARAAAMLENLLALYPKQEDAEERARQYLTLAERKLEQLRSSLVSRADEQLPQIAERLRTAKGMEAVDLETARGMYRAIVNLYGDEPWAKSVVHDAQRRLADLEVDGREESSR
jgi:hypothetical protein